MTGDDLDRYRRMFGEVALEQGFVTPAQLYEALTVQAKDKTRQGTPPRLLGQILLELGFMSAEQVQEVLDILYPVEQD